MSDQTAENTEAASQPVAPIRLLGQYIRDLSFEVPQAPEIFNILRQAAPEIPVSLDTDMRHLSGSTYEVTLSAHVEAFAAGKTAFILEVAYGCVVEINEQAVPEEHIHPILLIEVPRQMFPFVRQIVSDMTVNGGFPPLMLQIVDFTELYRNKFGVAVQKVARSDQVSPTIN